MLCLLPFLSRYVMLCKYAVTAAAGPLYEKPGSGIVLLGMLGLGLPPALGLEREREREELNLGLFVGIGQYSATLTLHPLRTLPVARNFYQYELTVHLTKQLPFPLWSGECVASGGHFGDDFRSSGKEGTLPTSPLLLKSPFTGPFGENVIIYIYTHTHRETEREGERERYIYIHMQLICGLGAQQGRTPPQVSPYRLP